MQVKTIEYKGKIIDVYEDGTVFVHTFFKQTANGQTRMYKGKFIKQADNGKGYKNYKFWHNNKHDHEYVHRLVALVFIPNPNNFLEINHIDGNKSNNHVSNLEWCDRKYNVNDYVKKGRGVYGWRKIFQLNALHEIIREYDSIESAAKEIGCTASNINMALRGVTKTAAGFVWKYAEPPKRKKQSDKNLINTQLKEEYKRITE